MYSGIPYFRSFPADFRSAIVAKIIEASIKGKNIQLVGPRGSGKSLLFRYLKSEPTILKDFDVYELDLNLIHERAVGAIGKLILENLKDWESKKNVFKKKTIVLVDSFENVLGMEESQLVNVFYGLMNRYRDYITFVFSVPRPIESKNVFWGSTVFMTPLNKEEFEWFYKGLGGVAEHKKAIYTATNGYMGLIKRLHEIAEDGGDISAAIENPRINPHLLYQLELMKEGLGKNKNYYDVPIFNTFINGVKVGGELTALENKAFQYLVKNKGVIMDREDLITQVWGEKALDIADHALDQLIHRLKIKVALEGYKIETIKGRGHRLI